MLKKRTMKGPVYITPVSEYLKQDEKGKNHCGNLQRFPSSQEGTVIMKRSTVQSSQQAKMIVKRPFLAFSRGFIVNHTEECTGTHLSLEYWFGELSSMEAIAVGAASNVLATLVIKTVKDLNNLIRSAQDVEEVQIELDRVKALVTEISNKINGQAANYVPNAVEDWLGKIQNALKPAAEILVDYGRHKQRVLRLGCCPHCFFWLRLGKRIREWKINIRELLEQGNSDFALICNINGVITMASKQETRDRSLVHPVPESGFVGTNIKSAQLKLQRWVLEDETARVISVYGMGGVGKTSLLKNVHNSEDVKRFFDVLIWATVSPNCSIKDLQSCIARRIHLSLPENCSTDEGAMSLYASLKHKKFLLILDDVWSQIDLRQLGVPIGGEGSKIVLTTRSMEVNRSMRADQCIRMEPLSEDEGWELFSKRIFGDELIPDGIQEIAKEVAGECKGLPLAINAVAAVMTMQTVDRREWLIALNQLKTEADTFYSINTNIDHNLFQRLKWSYNALPDNLKICFLYLALYPEDQEIDADELIWLWIAEGLVKCRDGFYSIDIGYSLLKVLRDRCMIEVSDSVWSGRICSVKLHDVLRHLAIFIGEKEEKCLFQVARKIEHFPLEVSADCRRISLTSNNIAALPTNFVCPPLLTLILAKNECLKEIPGRFLLNLPSLRVLDLRWTGIKSLPASIGQLNHLAYLQLSHTPIEELPETIGDLRSLEFLELYYCEELRYVPSVIGELQYLKHLNLWGCEKLSYLPSGISQLKSLERLELYSTCAVQSWEERTDSKEICLQDLSHLKRLRQISIKLNSAITDGVMGRFGEMRRLILNCNDVNQHTLPEDMQAMVELEGFVLENCSIIEMPNWVSRFQNLNYLGFFSCMELRLLCELESLPHLRLLQIVACKELRTLGAGFGRAGGFPMLEKLDLHSLHQLESVVEVVEEGAMPRLKKFIVFDCDQLRKLPLGMERLKSLEALHGKRDWFNQISWENENTKDQIQSVYKAL
eukprot:Gb_01077 [translate_table: standard]